MNKKLNKVVGLKKTEFDEFVQSKQIHVTPARLIPLLKAGDEMALTSIFLSTLRLVKEFRESIFSMVRLNKGGKAFYYTEVGFPSIDKDFQKGSRIDGLVVIVIGGIIRDAAFFEMKNRNSLIEVDQTEKYLLVAKKLTIGKLITISNQFVSDPTQSPINIKIPKHLSLFHLSWTSILTIAKLLFEKKPKIEDQDQIEIMKEVVSYFENKDSGVYGFTQMKSGWKETVENIRTGKQLNQSDKNIEEAVISWHQEERDMGLMLSRELGEFVKSSRTTSKNNLKGRLSDDIKCLSENYYLTSSLRVNPETSPMVYKTVSDIHITADFKSRNVTMAVKISAPLDKGMKGRISWLIKQLDKCKQKNRKTFEVLSNELMIEAQIKYSSENKRVEYNNIESLCDIDKNKDITYFKILAVKDFGKNFASSKKFIGIIEPMLIDFYQGIIQHLTNWEPTAPKIPVKKP